MPEAVTHSEFVSAAHIRQADPWGFMDTESCAKKTCMVCGATDLVEGKFVCRGCLTSVVHARLEGKLVGGSI